MMQYLPYVIGVLTAAACVVGGGRFFRRAAWRIGLIDGPKLRGVHAEPVAKSGGLTIAAALAGSLIAQMIAARALGLEQSYLTDIDHLYLLLPAFMIVGLGVMDDMRPLGAAPKLGVQVLAAITAWFLMFRIDGLFIPGLVDIPVMHWSISLALTTVFVVAVTNAFNMIDGVDGLCSGAAFIALFGIGMFAVNGGDFRIELALPLGAAALTFLKFNFGRPKTFLGDSGSMLLGFFVATLSLRAVTTDDGAIDVVPLFLLLSLPVVDITTVFFRRILQGANPLRADRGHIHHILMLIMNEDSRRTTGTLLFMAALGAAGAVWSDWMTPLTGVAVALPCGLYLAVYAAGGYASLHNLRGAGASSDAAKTLAERVEQTGAWPVLNSEMITELLLNAQVESIALLTDEGLRIWSRGAPDPTRDALSIPLYASGRVNRGRLLLQGRGRASRMAFAAHILLPLYPAFMEMLALEEATQPVQKVTARIR